MALWLDGSLALWLDGSGTACVRVADDLGDCLVGQRCRALVGAVLRVRLVLPRDAFEQPGSGDLDREAEAVEQGCAVRELGGGDFGATIDDVGTGRRAIEPGKRHGASILVVVRVLLLACTIIISLGFATPRLARGDGAGVIAASSTDRRAVAAAMADALAVRARRVVPDAVAEARLALAAGAVPVATMVRFRRVRELVDEGWRAYLRVAVEVAALRLAPARTEAEALVALPGGAEVYADAALRLGAVLGHLGRTSESQSILGLALALDPDRPVTLAEFSPDVVEAIDAVRAAPKQMQRLRISTTPPGASIRIDGTEVGRSPLELDVTRGQHLIVARAPLHQPTVEGIAVDHAAELTLVLEPDEVGSQIAGGGGLGLADRAQQTLLDAAIRYGDVDEIVLVAETTRRGGPALLVQRCAGLPARCSAVVDLGFGDRSGLAAAARAAWQAVRLGELRYPPSVLGERGGKPPGPRCEVCRSPWLWTGVGAALVVGTIITIVATSSSQPPPIVGVDPGQFLPR